LKPGIQRTPTGSAKADVVFKAAAVIQLALILHMTEGIHVGHSVAVIDHAHIIDGGFGAAASDRTEHVVVERRLGRDIPRQRDDTPATGQGDRSRLLLRGNQVEGAPLILVPPTPPIIETRRVLLNLSLRRRFPLGHNPLSLSSFGRPYVAAPGRGSTHKSPLNPPFCKGGKRRARGDLHESAA